MVVILLPVSACITSASDSIIQSPPVLAYRAGRYITRQERENGESKMEKLKIIPTNTMEKGTRKIDRNNLMEFYCQQMYSKDLSDRDIEEMLEVAYRWGV